MVKPYTEDGDIRIFSHDKPDSDYVWHRDAEDRKIKILEGNGWCLQFDDTLPYLLKPGQEMTIRKYDYHRLIKGVDDLVVRLDLI